jgi:proteasome lid subunit RPN8/RPN11
MDYSHLARQVRRFSPDDPYERCGYLYYWFNTGCISLREVANEHEEPWHMFRLRLRGISDLLPGRVLLGVFHTHPGRTRDGAIPSARDHAGAAKQPALRHTLYHPFTRCLVSYTSDRVIAAHRLKVRWSHPKGNL